MRKRLNDNLLLLACTFPTETLNVNACVYRIFDAFVQKYIPCAEDLDLMGKNPLCFGEGESKSIQVGSLPGRMSRGFLLLRKPTDNILLRDLRGQSWLKRVFFLEAVGFDATPVAD